MEIKILTRSPRFGTLLVFLALAIGSFAAYIPEMNMILSKDFFNAQISASIGAQIQKAIQDFNISDIAYNDTFDGVHIELNLVNTNKTVEINWNGNVLQVLGPYEFMIRAHNVNLTMHSHFEAKVGKFPSVKQKGELIINATKIICDVTLRFEQPKNNPSIGFDIQITNVFIAADDIEIKVQGKGVQNRIIKLVENLVKPRIPTILNNVIRNKVDPYLSQLTANEVSEMVSLGTEDYVVKLNTTAVPKFVANKVREFELLVYVDLTIQNENSNATNTEVENENLIDEHIFDGVANATVTLSSNMVNTVLWLVEDSGILHIELNSEKAGDKLPIKLNTKDLSILIPSLYSNWKDKDVILVIEPASTYDDLFIRNGRILTSISLKVGFVINLTDTTSSSVAQCIRNKECVSACTLNISLPVSAAMKLPRANFVEGLIHSASIHEIKVINTHESVTVNTETLKYILNTIVGSMVAGTNADLSDGILVNLPKKVLQFNVTGIYAKISKDYAAIGILSDL